jgi:hypothetical protein
MAIAAEPLSPSGLPLAADWAAVSIAAALETRVNASTGIASTAVAIAVAITNNNIAAAAADNKNNDNDDIRTHPAP